MNIVSSPSFFSGFVQRSLPWFGVLREEKTKGITLVDVGVVLEGIKGK